MLTRENGLDSTAEVLRKWLMNKDREHDEPGGSGNGNTHRKYWKMGCPGPLDALESTVPKRLHMKQSFDHALNTFKAHSHSDTHSHTLADLSSKRHPSPAEPASLLHSTLPPNQTTN